MDVLGALEAMEAKMDAMEARIRSADAVVTKGEETLADAKRRLAAMGIYVELPEPRRRIAAPPQRPPPRPGARPVGTVQRIADLERRARESQEAADSMDARSDAVMEGLRIIDRALEEASAGLRGEAPPEGAPAAPDPDDDVPFRLRRLVN